MRTIVENNATGSEEAACPGRRAPEAKRKIVQVTECVMGALGKESAPEQGDENFLYLAGRRLIVAEAW